MKHLCPLEARIVVLWFACMFIPWLTAPKGDGMIPVSLVTYKVDWQPDSGWVRVKLDNGKVEDLFYSRKNDNPDCLTFDYQLDHAEQGDNFRVKTSGNMVTEMDWDWHISIWTPLKYAFICWYFIGLLCVIRRERHRSNVILIDVPEICLKALGGLFHFRLSRESFEKLDRISCFQIAPNIIPSGRRLK